MTDNLRVFVSSVQKELEDERLIVQNLLVTDAFLSAHCSPVLYELEPASPTSALDGCIEALDTCQVCLLIVGVEYGARVDGLSITHTEYRRAKELGLPVLAFIKGGRGVEREEGTSDLLAELDTDGPKYKRFGNVIELQREVRAALVRLLRDDHGLDRPLIGSDTGYLQITFVGPGEDMERLRVPENQFRVTPAIEAQLNERQRRILSHVLEHGSVTRRWCVAEFGVVNDTAGRDLKSLVELGLLLLEGKGRAAHYVILPTKSTDNRPSR